MNDKELFLCELSNCLFALNDCPFEKYRRMSLTDRIIKVNKLHPDEVKRFNREHLHCENKKENNTNLEKKRKK